MQIEYTLNAFNQLAHIVNFIESKNTAGAGLRWLYKFECFLNKSLVAGKSLKNCNNQTFSELNLYCVNFNDWVIAYSFIKKKFIIEVILHNSRLID